MADGLALETNRGKSTAIDGAAEVRAGRTIVRVDEVLTSFRERDTRGDVVTAVRRFPARPAVYAEWPEWLSGSLREAYRNKGISRPYAHQALAAEAVHTGKHVVIVTPTASGKTLCYNLPVVDAILQNADTRALYLFPTKALAQDQLAELYDLQRRLEEGGRYRVPGGKQGDQTPHGGLEPLEGGFDQAGPAGPRSEKALSPAGARRAGNGRSSRQDRSGSFGVFTYDGDTPSDARKAIREKGHIVLSNPDMLHTGILPHHTRWTRLFENLQYIVIDELHSYRGVFGSHLCNVLRRLRRIASFYGSTPQFICCSATIANPGELAERLIEDRVEVLSENGAPAGEKTFVFYNPPVVNRALGIRRSYINESSRVAQEFLKRDLQTMVFANSRLNTEILLTYLQKANSHFPGMPEPIRGYRGGYLPGERREIERGLREGKIRGVVSTSALELGIDVGSLDATVMAGYPGTIAATWQRAGRAGRRSGSSCAVMVASSAPLDQFMVRHPDYFFGNTPEHAYIQPDNLEIVVNHLKCAAFELPLEPQERFAEVNLPELCARLEQAGYLHRAGAHYHWTQEAYPADTVSLRSVTSDNFVIIDTTGAPEVIGEVDFPGALTTLHEKAIYLHGAEQYHVEHLDFKERKAYVKKVDVDYYTDAIEYTQVRVLEIAGERRSGDEGRLLVPGNAASAESAEDEHAARSGTATGSSRSLHAHGDVLVRSQVVGFKKIKFFTNENIGFGQLQLPENEMHTTSYWMTLKRALLESLPFSTSERQSGTFGLLYAMKSVATLLLMCDGRDLGSAIGERPPAPGAAGEEFLPVPPQEAMSGGPAKEFFEPNLYLYDAYPGGIGFSEPLYRASGLLLAKTRELIAECECDDGCPSCVGPAGDLARRAKEAALAILQGIGA
ncbi:MAG TPA: DEAD/DEAH box helicase [Candidatus Acidoferrum sp.]|nr:DEAD/DEAH box helicase [Candidatus Acidoferrum sp.]